MEHAPEGSKLGPEHSARTAQRASAECRISVRIRHRDEFLEVIGRYFEPGDDVDPEAVARAVFTVLQMHVTEGEIEDVRHILPSEIRELWPEVPQEARR